MQEEIVGIEITPILELKPSPKPFSISLFSDIVKLSFGKTDIKDKNISYKFTAVKRKKGQTKKGTYFLTNPEIQKIIKKEKLENIYLGRIKYEPDYVTKDIVLMYYPFRTLKKAFEGKGIASLIELFCLRDMIKRGFGKYQLRYRAGTKERKQQLEQRYNLKYEDIKETKPFVREEYTVLKEFVKRETKKTAPKKERPRVPFLKRLFRRR